MVTQISENGSVELHINSWIDQQDQLALVVSLYPREGYYIPQELDFKVNLLVLPLGDAERVGAMSKIGKPTGVS